MRVLFAYDGSSFAKRALRYASHLGPDLDAIVMTVTQVLLEAPHTEASTDPEQDAQKGRERLEEGVQVLKESGIDAVPVHALGNPAAEILAAAEDRGVDLIVVGHRGRSAIARFMEGSVSDRIVRHAPCDVLVVR